MAKKRSQWWQWVLADAALYAFLYYVQYLLNVSANLWLSSLILGILLNVAIIFCPVLGKGKI